MLIIIDNTTGCQMLTKEKKAGTLEFSCKICITEHETNADITDEQNICNLDEITVDYICKWTHHLSRMNDTHISNLVYEYTLTRRTKSTSGKMERPKHTEAWMAVVAAGDDNVYLFTVQ
jgi:hypothetical protein